MTCPRCKKEYKGHPALSRNGLGDICPRCGYEEALLAIGMSEEKVKAMVDEMVKAEATVSSTSSPV